MAGWILLAGLILLVLWVILVYNGLVTSRNQVQNGWRQIDVQMNYPVASYRVVHSIQEMG